MVFIFPAKRSASSGSERITSVLSITRPPVHPVQTFSYGTTISVIPAPRFLDGFDCGEESSIEVRNLLSYLTETIQEQLLNSALTPTRSRTSDPRSRSNPNSNSPGNCITVKLSVENRSQTNSDLSMTGYNTGMDLLRRHREQEKRFWEYTSLANLGYVPLSSLLRTCGLDNSFAHLEASLMQTELKPRKVNIPFSMSIVKPTLNRLTNMISS